MLADTGSQLQRLEERQKSALSRLSRTVSLLDNLCELTSSAPIKAISRLSRGIVAYADSLGTQEDAFFRLLENTDAIIHAIIEIYLSEPETLVRDAAPLPRFIQTLQKLHRFFELELERKVRQGRFKRFIKRGFLVPNNSALLRDCQEELDQALAEFKISHTGTARLDFAAF
ncbi:hypothetical protein MKEN_00578200 [Mycena kentingensis (nom. inval.)]|nr:hypothetical protein MKEN_00578200 [Mycena kentingensis (nom. inval.)]